LSGSAPYLVVGFALTWGVILLYVWRLESRLGSARSRLERHGGSGSRVRPPDQDGEARGEPTAAEPHEGPEEMR